MEYITLAPGALMVFAPVIPYIPQGLAMIKEKSSEGFSSYVCLVLLVANILRICFFYGKRFGLELLFQSIFMIIVQIGMLYIWFLFRSRRDRSVKSEFWNWDSFIMYLLYIGGFAVISGALTLLLSGLSIYVESVGTISLLVESLLGTPQAIANFKRKSTKGMSLGMIGGWFLGDGFKTIWFIINGEPLQFLMCGIIQLTVDVIILIQVFVYQNREGLI